MVAVAQSSRSLEMRVTRVRKARAVPATRRKRTPLRPGRGSWHTSTSKWDRGSGPPAPPCRQASRNGCGWRHRQRAAAVACRRAAIRASGGRELVSFTLQGNRSSLGAVSVLSQGRWQLVTSGPPILSGSSVTLRVSLEVSLVKRLVVGRGRPEGRGAASWASVGEAGGPFCTPPPLPLPARRSRTWPPWKVLRMVEPRARRLRSPDGGARL